MNEHNRIHSLHEGGERNTSNYAEIYFDDEYCEHTSKHVAKNENDAATTSKKEKHPDRDTWISPSDLMIGKVDLVPPFTSRITRGITHEGILKIGEAVLQRERTKFLKRLAELLAANDTAWFHIQEEEKKLITEKVRVIYEQIFVRKSSAMQKELSDFYEDTLKELEEHLRTEVRTIMISTHCNMIHDLNIEIKERLEYEKKILEKELRKRYDSEVRKMKKYYKLLLRNEKDRSNQLVNQAVAKRNEALRSFCKQIEIEATTSTMYVMCTERKKCKMRKFLLERFHDNEIEEKLKVLKEKEEILDEFTKHKRSILDINKDWEEKVRKILQLFLKFISFSLKLLPEQTTFLLDLEKLVVLQLNEIQKYPEHPTSILINSDDVKNLFEFQEPDKPEFVCDDEGPFVVVGDTAPSVSTEYGSQESVPLHKDLPYFRLNRQHIYAKCQKIQEVRDLLHPCKCHEQQPLYQPEKESSSSKLEETTLSPETTPKSSNELFLVDDIERLHNCPSRNCQDYIGKLTFPDLNEYLDFSQEKFMRVNAILSKTAKLQPAPESIDPKAMVYRELPFATTKETHRNKETQCSSKEDMTIPEDPACTCFGPHIEEKKLPPAKSEAKLREEKIEEILVKRKDDRLDLNPGQWGIVPLLC
ncbi:hypothetical protein NE865_05984 [Phthorimaea operculella]|nr:hypothetical protein NE865_05984 [Phthorimaea operculella]